MGYWTCNTDSYAMSQYKSPPFREAAMVSGRLCVITDAGLAVMESDTDDGAPIDAEIQWGESDFGSDALKHLSYIYIGYRATSGVCAFVECDCAGEQVRPEYDFPERIADSIVTGRLKTGRGLRSRMFSIGIQSIDGGDFELHDMSVMIDPTARRI